MRIAILGASGFVGSRLYARLSAQQTHEVVPVVRNLGKAWPILRLGATPRVADVLNQHELQSAISDCECVVNCSLGISNELPASMKSIVGAVVAGRVGKLIHLSSIAIYGERPDSSTVDELGRTNAAKGSYGWFKLQQDQIIQNECPHSIDRVILCPPQVGGPGSRFLRRVVEEHINGTFQIVDGGSNPCVMVDVDNLCCAIIDSALKGINHNGRIHITNGDDYCWKHLSDQVVNEFGTQKALEIKSDLASRTYGGRDVVPLRRLIQHLVTDREFVELARNTRLMQNSWAINTVRSIMNRVRRKAGPTRNCPKIETDLAISSLCRQQLRGIRHEIGKAREVIGYAPIYDSHQSVKRFVEEFKFSRGWITDLSRLYRLLDSSELA